MALDFVGIVAVNRFHFSKQGSRTYRFIFGDERSRYEFLRELGVSRLGPMVPRRDAAFGEAA